MLTTIQTRRPPFQADIPLARPPPQGPVGLPVPERGSIPSRLLRRHRRGAHTLAASHGVLQVLQGLEVYTYRY